jgi:hypothetical protein
VRERLAIETHEVDDAVTLLEALADPIRWRLVRILCETDGCLACSEIPLAVGNSTISHYLKVLRCAPRGSAVRNLVV